MVVESVENDFDDETPPPTSSSDLQSFSTVDLDDDNPILDWQIERDSTKSNGGKPEQSNMQDFCNYETNVLCSQSLDPSPRAIKVNVSEHFITNQVFDSKKEIVDWCRQVGAMINTVVLIQRYEDARARLILHCERGGEYKSHLKKSYELPSRTMSTESKKKSSSGTKKCNCPFKLKGVSMGNGKWMLEILCGDHNHELAHTLQGHTYAGRLNPEEEEIVVDMSKSGIKARQILSTLKRKNHGNMLRHIHNLNSKIRKKDFEGRSMMQQLMYLLVQDNYVHYELKDDKEDVIRSLFWAHPKSIIMLRCFPEVILLDCTYKTNRYRLPFLEGTLL